MSTVEKPSGFEWVVELGDEITSTWTKFRGELVICFDLLRALFKDPQKSVPEKYIDPLYRDKKNYNNNKFQHTFLQNN